MRAFRLSTQVLPENQLFRQGLGAKLEDTLENLDLRSLGTIRVVRNKFEYKP